MPAMRIRNSRPLYIALLVVGVLLLVVSLMDTRVLGIVAGVVLSVLGVLGQINPALKIEEGEVRMCNPLGMVMRRFPVSSPADLRFQDKHLVHVPTGKKIVTLGFGYHADDVQQLRALVPGGTQA